MFVSYPVYIYQTYEDTGEKLAIYRSSSEVLPVQIIAFLSVFYSKSLHDSGNSYQLLESCSQNPEIKVEDFAVFSLVFWKNVGFSRYSILYYYRRGRKSAVIPTLFLILCTACTQKIIFALKKFGKLGFWFLRFWDQTTQNLYCWALTASPFNRNEPERCDILSCVVYISKTDILSTFSALILDFI